MADSQNPNHFNEANSIEKTAVGGDSYSGSYLVDPAQQPGNGIKNPRIVIGLRVFTVLLAIATIGILGACSKKPLFTVSLNFQNAVDILKDALDHPGAGGNQFHDPFYVTTRLPCEPMGVASQSSNTTATAICKKPAVRNMSSTTLKGYKALPILYYVSAVSLGLEFFWLLFLLYRSYIHEPFNWCGFGPTWLKWVLRVLQIFLPRMILLAVLGGFYKLSKDVSATKDVGMNMLICAR
jgi:hypothetical protein